MLFPNIKKKIGVQKQNPGGGGGGVDLFNFF